MALFKSWRPVERATLYMQEYCVVGFRLYDDFYCGEDDMSDCPCKCPLDGWMLEIESWYDGLYGKTASFHSDIRMSMEFADRVSANRVWQIIRDTEPDYAILEKMGFTRIP